jgi:hypothetical protein
MREINARNTYLMRETNARRSMRNLNESKAILELNTPKYLLAAGGPWESAERLIEEAALPQMAMTSGLCL